MKSQDTILHAYPDGKCVWGYLHACSICASNKPLRHVDWSTVIRQPPAVNKEHNCEICGCVGTLK